MFTNDQAVVEINSNILSEIICKLIDVGCVDICGFFFECLFLFLLYDNSKYGEISLIYQHEWQTQAHILFFLFHSKQNFIIYDVFIAS